MHELMLFVSSVCTNSLIAAGFLLLDSGGVSYRRLFLLPSRTTRLHHQNTKTSKVCSATLLFDANNFQKSGFNRSVPTPYVRAALPED